MGGSDGLVGPGKFPVDRKGGRYDNALTFVG